MASRLVFSEGNHTYSLDGRRVPGVTTIIRNATNKPALPPSAAKETALWAAANVEALPTMGADRWVRNATSAYRDVWNASALRGTLLHDAARQLVNGDPLTPVDADGNQWPDDVIRSAEQLARFMDEWDAQPVLAERPVFHETDLWAGTLDLVADLRDGHRWLLDYKTGRTGVYPESAMQQAAYRHATHVQDVDDAGELVDRPMVPVDRAGVVWVRPDFYELRPVRADGVMYERFRHMIPVSDWTTWKPDQTVAPPAAVPAVAS